jgi:rhodanese-related sulfurtransferase
MLKYKSSEKRMMKMINAQDLVAEARQSIKEIAPISANRCAAAGAALVDVREPAEFDSGHIPGAVNIPRGVLEFEIFSNPATAGVTAAVPSDRSRAIVVYCRSGGRAALAAASLVRLQFTNVSSIAGGILAWEAAGLRTTTVS